MFAGDHEEPIAVIMAALGNALPRSTRGYPRTLPGQRGDTFGSRAMYRLHAVACFVHSYGRMFGKTFEKVTYGAFLAVAIALTGCGRQHGDAEAARSQAASANEATAGAEDVASASDWVPAEHKLGIERWRDTGVYVDGVPVGFLYFAELPRTMKTIWIERNKALPFGPGEEQKFESVRVPRFAIADYLEAVGIDLATIKEVHIASGRSTAMVFSGQALIQNRDKILFRFAGDVYGKTLPELRDGVERNTDFDNMAMVAVYIDKPPPTLTEEDTLVLNGEHVDEVPYFGAPLRGGVRVYKDDRLATVIKRNKVHTAAGEQRFPLFDFLKAQGVDTANVVEAEIIYEEERTGQLGRSELETLYFTLNDKSKGEILLGKDQKPVHALLLFSKAMPAEEAEQRMKYIEELKARDDFE